MINSTTGQDILLSKYNDTNSLFEVINWKNGLAKNMSSKKNTPNLLNNNNYSHLKTMSKIY